ncbi:probable WRKY transcription factor 62 [Zingiber officinale]|uniref:WRKY domain-containing protein n=1 Tax=Zingiber officinale TaxID=94328 RepID=A0A8J5FKI8_ZINOF|nr:probable WRKY transcription factor 62 [Zingiber officinale]KAG6488753.1 hypothetical protein ZIOFF_050002 [Zingiber officinale]
MGSGEEHWTVIQDISRAQELTGQLQAVLLPLLPDAGGWSELARDHMREMIRCYASALDRLRTCGSPESQFDIDAYKNDRSRSSDEKCRKKQLKLEGGYKSWPPRDTKRRFKQDDSYSIVTSIPYEDGHQWRKYGQKPIQGSKHQRSYFRCTYSKEQGCRARKTVQQEDTNVYPPKYRVVYAMSHTCSCSSTSVISLPIFVLDSVLPNNNSLPLLDTSSDINNIVQHQQHAGDLCVPPKSELVGGIMHPSTSEAITDDETNADADAMVLKLLISPELDAFYEAIMDNIHASGG